MKFYKSVSGQEITLRSLMLKASLFAVACPGFLQAQDVDTLSTVAMDEVVVTADRSESMRSQSTGAVSVLKSTTIRQLAGVRGLAGALQQVPGFAMLHLDGIGYDAQPIVRGFYGGGEAEYVLLMVDGQPVNALETGLVNWDQIPLVAIESVEILRGGASSLYGDAAIGGVINIVTDSEASSRSELAVFGGSFGTFKGSGSLRTSLGVREFSSYGNYETLRGYREHADRTKLGVGVSSDVFHSDRVKITLSGSMHVRNYDIPGPLTSEQIANDRVQQSPFFQLDDADERTQRLALQGRMLFGEQSELRTSIVGNRRSLEGTRTLPLSAEFADAKWRDFGTSRMFFSAQLVTPSLFADDRLTLGADLQRGGLDVEWHDVVTGTAEDFQAHDGTIGELSSAGNGTRSALAAYLQYDIEPMSRLRASAGIRYDRISDAYSPEQGTNQDAVHTALSPKVGLNIRYVANTQHVGNWYANVTRSFKTATLDQLFGQRLIPLPFPPYATSISNHELKPQRGTSFETGLYHRSVLVPESLSGELALSIYQMDMKDELDFQFETFQYANIASSRHRGLEAGLSLETENLASLRFNYTLQNVTYRSGGNEGNFVKAIPRDYISAAVSLPIRDRIQAMTTLRSARRIWLDDANTVELENFSSADFKLTYAVDRFTIEFEAFNLLNNLYSTTGFLDPGGSDTVFVYPAAGRAMQLGVGVAW